MVAVLLILKLVLAPALVVLSTLAGRRWGPGVTGVLVALPVVAGPILLITELDHGRQFAARAAGASLLGLVTLALFALVFARVCAVLGPIPTLGFGWGICLLADLALSAVTLTPTIGLVLALAGAGIAWALMPADPPAPTDGPPASPPWPWWDLPARAAATVVLVLVLTGAADHLGPSLTGVLAPFPIATSVVAAFALTLRGYPASVALLKGVLRGLVGFATFCFLVATLVVPAGPVSAFAGALGAALAVQLIVRRTAARIARRAVPEPATDGVLLATPGRKRATPTKRPTPVA
jgi:hypothetical protein